MNKNNTARTVWFTMVIAGCVILCLINVFLWKDDAKLPHAAAGCNCNEHGARRDSSHRE